MMKKFEDFNYYELLKIPFNASSFEVRQAYKNILTIYEENSLATYSLFSEEERRMILVRIEKAFLALVDNEKRLASDNNLVKRGEMAEGVLAERGRKKAIPIFKPHKARPGSSNITEVGEKTREKGVKKPLPKIPVGEVISGKDLKNLRVSRGIELEEFFQVTKISPTTLEVIEKDDIGNLPPTVYLKSFLKSYAEILQLDAKEIVDGYLRNKEKRWSAEHGALDAEF